MKVNMRSIQGHNTVGQKELHRNPPRKAEKQTLVAGLYLKDDTNLLAEETQQQNTVSSVETRRGFPCLRSLNNTIYVASHLEYPSHKLFLHIIVGSV